MLGFYFALQVVVRMCLSSTLDLDEAEQVLSYRQLALGYDTQPPLYAWLQSLVFTVFGLNLFSLAVLKNLLLFSTYAFFFYTARQLTGTSAAIAAASSLLLLPQIAWESQRDLTHSVLLTSLASATLCAYFALLRKPSAARYALLGLLIGLGLQSKYNFALFLATLTSASLLTPEHRRALWNAKALIAVAVAFLCLAPHGYWLLDHVGTAAGGTMQKMREGSRDAGYVRNVAAGLGSMMVATLAFLTPLWLVYGLACRHSFRGAKVKVDDSTARFFLVFLAACFVWLTVLVFTGKVIKIKDRWLQPLLFVVPLAFFVLLPGASSPRVHRRIVQVAVLAALAILIAISSRAYIGERLGKGMRANLPYSQLAAELTRRFPQADTLIGGDKHTAGNLMFQRPGLNVLELSEVMSRPLDHGAQALIVVRGGWLDDWPDRFSISHPHLQIIQTGSIELPFRSRNAELMIFNYALAGPRNP